MHYQLQIVNTDKDDCKLIFTSSDDLNKFLLDLFKKPIFQDFRVIDHDDNDVRKTRSFSQQLEKKLLMDYWEGHIHIVKFNPDMPNSKKMFLGKHYKQETNSTHIDK